MTAILATIGASLVLASIPQQDALVYLWAPGVLLLALAFRRAITRPVDPRPGYIIGKDQHHDHHQH